MRVQWQKGQAYFLVYPLCVEGHHCLIASFSMAIISIDGGPGRTLCSPAALLAGFYSSDGSRDPRSLKLSLAAYYPSGL